MHTVQHPMWLPRKADAKQGTEAPSTAPERPGVTAGVFLYTSCTDRFNCLVCALCCAFKPPLASACMTCSLHSIAFLIMYRSQWRQGS